MARRKGPGSTGIVAELKRRGVDVGVSAPEAADDNMAICGMFGISKPTLRRWRDERGFPESDFTIGLREFTWRRRIMAWIEQQPKRHPKAGKRFATEAA